MTFALIAGTKPGTDIIVPVSAVCSAGCQFDMQRAGREDRTHVLRKIGSGCHRAWGVVYVSVWRGFGMVGWVGCLPTGLMVVTLRMMVKACWRDGNPDNMFRLLEDGLGGIYISWGWGMEWNWIGW